MALKDLIEKLKSGEDYVELEHEELPKEEKQLCIEVEKLDNFGDSDRLQRKLREGGVLLIKIRDLRARNPEELKRSVERIRRTCIAVSGDIAGLGEDWLLVTSAAARIYREPQNE